MLPKKLDEEGHMPAPEKIGVKPVLAEAGHYGVLSKVQAGPLSLLGW
jgi:hypothetical protein